MLWGERGRLANAGGASGGVVGVVRCLAGAPRLAEPPPSFPLPPCPPPPPARPPRSKRLQWQSKLLERMSDVAMRHNHLKSQALRDLLDADGGGDRGSDRGGDRDRVDDGASDYTDHRR